MSKYQLLARNTSLNSVDENGQPIPRLCSVHTNVNLYQVDRFLAQCKNFFSALSLLKKYYPDETRFFPLVNQFEIYDDKGNRYDCVYDHKALYEAAKHVIVPSDGRATICFRETEITYYKKQELLSCFRNGSFVAFLNDHSGYFSNTMKQEIKQYCECAKAIENGEIDSDARNQFLKLEQTLKDQLLQYKIYRGAIAAEIQYENWRKNEMSFLPLGRPSTSNRSFRSPKTPMKKSNMKKLPSPMDSNQELSFCVNTGRLDEADLILTEEEIIAMYGYQEEPKQKRMGRLPH